MKFSAPILPGAASCGFYLAPTARLSCRVVIIVKLEKVANEFSTSLA